MSEWDLPAMFEYPSGYRDHHPQLKVLQRLLDSDEADVVPTDVEAEERAEDLPPGLSQSIPGHHQNSYVNREKDYKALDCGMPYSWV